MSRVLRHHGVEYGRLWLSAAVITAAPTDTRLSLLVERAKSDPRLQSYVVSCRQALPIGRWVTVPCSVALMEIGGIRRMAMEMMGMEIAADQFFCSADG